MISEVREVPAARRSRFGRFLERAAPGLAARRLEADLRLRRARLAGKMLEGLERQAHQFTTGGYSGATKDRGYTNWNPGVGSADDDSIDGLEMLRGRCRDLTRNDTHASGLLDTWVSNIVGTGLRPQSRVDRETLGLTEDQADQYQKVAEAIFARWWKQADAAACLSFGEIQDLILRGIFENGDAAVLPRPVSSGLPALRLQVLEADRIMTPLSESANVYVRDGVVIDDRGAHVAYWVKKTHPGDELGRRDLNDFIRIPTFDPTSNRRNIWHLYKTRRPDQSRGIPALAPAMLLFRDLQQYFRAELFASKVAACFALFVTTPDPSGVLTAQSTASNNQRIETLEPGMIKYLDTGQKIEAANPGRPNVNFDPFVLRVLRAIGSCVQMPYEEVSCDFSQTTYTSGRMALTAVRRVYLGWRGWLVEKFLQDIYSQVLEEAYLAGELPAGQDFYERFDLWTAARWVGPGWSWVDPEKEVNAAVTAMANHLTTLADEAASRGLDWEEMLEQIGREDRKRKALGLTQIAAPPPAPKAPPAKETEGEDDGDDKNEDEIE